MISVARAVVELVRQSPHIEYALMEGVVNVSALARVIRPEIENALFKTVTEGSIVMALKRYQLEAKQTRAAQSRAFTGVRDMVIRSNLAEITVRNGADHQKLMGTLLASVRPANNQLFILTQGVFETTIICSGELKDSVEQACARGHIVSLFEGLSAIILGLNDDAITASGVYYHLLRPFAMESIQIVEIASTFTELTILVQDADIDRAFSALKRSISHSISRVTQEEKRLL